MTDRERVIVTAYTGIAMITGEKFNLFYEYLNELCGRPVYTHEIPLLEDEIKERSKADFLKLCEDEKDVVEVVRCKDCKHFMFSSLLGYYICIKDEGMCEPDPDDFCSMGERREHENT